jgi:hypothetical protein
VSGSDARFGTVAILAPLPNGDRAFTVEFARHQRPIRAGQRLDLTRTRRSRRRDVPDHRHRHRRVDVINPPKSIARYDLV